VSEWAQRIVSIMDDEDLGVVVSVTSLIMAMAQDNLDAFSVCYQKAVDRLHKVRLFGLLGSVSLIFDCS
jgi:AP-2 complex subunit alpha